MYIERGVYDWRRTAHLMVAIAKTIPGRKGRLDPEKLNPFLPLKTKKRQPSSRIPLSMLGKIMPGIKVVDNRQKPSSVASSVQIRQTAMNTNTTSAARK